MAEQETVAPTQLVRVVDSKLYNFLRTKQALQYLIPDIATQIHTEQEMESVYPRLPEDGIATRVFINYTNSKGNPVLYKTLDTQRLNRQFDLDNFMNGYVKAIADGLSMPEGDSDEASTKIIEDTILHALNFAVATILGLNAGEGANENTKAVSYNLVFGLAAVLFNDARDVIIAVNDLPMKEDQALPDTAIVGMWILKQRPQEEIGLLEPDLIAEEIEPS